MNGYSIVVPVPSYRFAGDTGAARVIIIGYVGSYLWHLRQKVGHDLLVTPAAVVVALDPADAVLLMRRADTGHWAVPGGSAEPGSTFATTAIQELHEETGLAADMSDLEAFASLSDGRWTNFTFPNRDVVHSFNLCFALRRWRGSLRVDDEEATDVGFFAREALPTPLLPMTDRVLELWAEHERTGRFVAG